MCLQACAGTCGPCAGDESLCYVAMSDGVRWCSDWAAAQVAEFLVDEDGRAPYGVDMRRPEHPPVASSRAGERCGQKRLSSETFFLKGGECVWLVVSVLQLA